MPEAAINVLFLCTGNSARSIIAESILRKDGSGRFNAYSAGSYPRADVNPLAVAVLEGRGYPTEGLRSKSWDEFGGPDTPKMDVVLTVCDDAAKETCPVWPGHPVSAHWGIEDPANVDGSEVERRAAFERTFDYLQRRVAALVALPVASLDRDALERQAREIGALEGATATAR